MKRLDQWIGVWLGVAILLQAVLLAMNTAMSRAQAVQFFAGAVCVMLLVATLWRARRYFNSHIDMLLIMFASGGLGMLLGMPLSHHLSHTADFTVWWRMCAAMLLFGIAPAVAFSRCLRAARQRGVLTVALLIDFSAMLAGMWLSTPVSIGPDEHMLVNRHLAMLGGMMLGMIVGMWIRSVLLLPAGSYVLRAQCVRRVEPRPAPGASPCSSSIQYDRNSAREGHAQTERLPHLK